MVNQYNQLTISELPSAILQRIGSPIFKYYGLILGVSGLSSNDSKDILAGAIAYTAGFLLEQTMLSTDIPNKYLTLEKRLIKEIRSLHKQ